MKKLFNFMLVALAACGISCSNLGDENTMPGNGGNDNNDNSGDTNVTTTFVVEVSDITPLGAYVSVTPSDNATTYYFDVVSKEEMGKYVDAKALAKVMISNLKEYCESYEQTLADVLSKGVDGYNYISYFTPNTEYYALAFGVDADGMITTGVTTEPFTTLEEVVDASMTFDVKVTDITSNGALVLITPSNNNAIYYFDVVTKEKLDEYPDTKEYAERLIKVIKEPYDFYGKPFVVVLSAGAVAYQFEAGRLAPNTEYYAIAFGVTTAGKVTTDVTTVPFKTSVQ